MNTTIIDNVSVTYIGYPANTDVDTTDVDVDSSVDVDVDSSVDVDTTDVDSSVDVGVTDFSFNANLVTILEALESLSSLYTDRPVHHVQTLIKLQNTNGRLTLTSTNISSQVIKYLPGIVNGADGGVCVPYTLLTELVDRLVRTGIISANIAVTDKFTITYGYKGKIVLNCTSGDEFISYQDIDKHDQEIVIDCKSFKKSLGAASKFISKDKSRSSLLGITLKADGINSYLMSSDGHKISKIPCVVLGDKLDIVLDPITGDLLPDSGLISLKIHNPTDRTDRPIITYKTKDKMVVIPAIASSPIVFNWPKKYQQSLTLTARDLLEALMPINALGINTVFLKTGNNSLSLITDSSDEEIFIQSGDSSPGTVILDPNYIINTLAGIGYAKPAKRTKPVKKTKKKQSVDYDLKIDISGQIVSFTNLKTNYLCGIAPKTPINDRHHVTINNPSMGYCPPIALPYKYDDGVLTVTDDLYDDNGNWLFLKPELNTVLFEQERRYKEEAERVFKETREAEKAIANYIKIEEILLSGKYTIKELKDFTLDSGVSLDYLKKKYKTVRNFRDKFFCLESPSKWDQALTLYNRYIKLYNGLILEVIHRLTPDQVEDQGQTNTNTNTKPNPDTVTVAFLKKKYNNFKEAKEDLGIKAVSWDKLAEKYNAKTNSNTNSNTSSSTKSSTSVEQVVHELKKKYVKFSEAKIALEIKAASWNKLAELYILSTNAA